jgi:BirA family biotin operon repressor/biotin-[acetyl-CoA-carboxylase] ligase
MNPADWPNVPPGYTLRLCAGDAFATACKAGVDGAEDGLLLWVDRHDRCEAALLLRPLDPVQAALTLGYVGLLGLHDGLAAVAPAETPASVSWPDRLLVNDACVGGIRVAHGALVEKQGMADVPDWLVIGLTVQMLPLSEDDDAPGTDLDYTNLHEEGCGEVTVPKLLESFSRHALHWLDRWQEDGFEPVRKAFLHDLDDKALKIEANGDAWHDEVGVKKWHALRDALRQPTWSLPEPALQSSAAHPS